MLNWWYLKCMSAFDKWIQNNNNSTNAQEHGLIAGGPWVFPNELFKFTI